MKFSIRQIRSIAISNLKHLWLMISNYFSCLRYYQPRRKIQMLVFLVTISLVHTSTQSEQSSDITRQYTDSSTGLKKSVKKLKDTDKGSGETDTLSLPVVAKPVRQRVKKATHKPDTGKLALNPAPENAKLNERMSKDVVIHKSDEIPLEQKTKVNDIHTEVVNDLNNSANKTVAPKAKNVDLEKPIEEREIVSPKTIGTLKSAEKNDYDKKKGISPPEKVVEIAQEKAKSKVIDKPVDKAKNLTNSDNNIVAPKAQNVSLEKPINESEIVSSDTNSSNSADQKDSSDNSGGVNSAELIVKKPVSKKQTEKLIYDKPFLLLGSAIPPGTSTRLAWKSNQSFQGISAPTPVLVVNGVQPGPVLCLTAAIHGDEVNGIEIVRRVLYNLKVEELSGTVIGVPIVNLQGFRRSSRYLPDRRDLNRFFPGNPQGSSASRIAYSFFNEIIIHCNILVDLHTGSFHRTNIPQLRADLNSDAVVEVTQGFGATVILQSVAAKGTLRRAALDYGIPAVTLEAGEPMRMQQRQVAHGVKGVQTLMNKYGMYDYSSFWGDPEPVYYQSKWVRANKGGILFSQVGLGDKIKQGKLLGTVTDPITNVKSKIISPYKGRIIGMALNQFVMPGYATFHIGIHTDENKLIDIDNQKKVESNDISENTEKNNQIIVEYEKHKSELSRPDELIETE